MKNIFEFYSKLIKKEEYKKEYNSRKKSLFEHGVIFV